MVVDPRRKEAEVRRRIPRRLCARIRATTHVFTHDAKARHMHQPVHGEPHPRETDRKRRRVPCVTGALLFQDTFSRVRISTRTLKQIFLIVCETLSVMYPKEISTSVVFRELGTSNKIPFSTIFGILINDQMQKIKISDCFFGIRMK